MILTVPQFLDSRELGELRQQFARQPERVGSATAGGAAGAVKNNVEIATGERAEKLKQMVLDACNRAPLLNYLLLPRWVSKPILSLYQTGMAYGRHIDSAVGNDAGRIYRSDLSCTIFLDPPDSYEGGELSIESAETPERFKLPAGHAVFYPTLHMHEVLPVRAGVRRACVFWLESLVRDPGDRELLADMTRLCEWVRDAQPADSEHRLRMNKVRENLYRKLLDT